MEMELLNLPQGSKTRLQARMRAYKTDLERLKQTLVGRSKKIPTSMHVLYLYVFVDCHPHHTTPYHTWDFI
jgi:hypothetical protein